MSLGWIDPSNYSFYCLTLMERFQLRLLLDNAARCDELGKALGIALRHSEPVGWYVQQKCPEHAALTKALIVSAPDVQNARDAELAVLGSIEDFVTYTTPDVMATKCDFIRDWSKERLYELCDLTGKRVLDVGSGSGRLAFAAAEKAREVYASEPVDTLREFLRDEIVRRGVTNMRVLDGMADSLPFPGDTFDVVMSGHVVGDDYDGELRELTRVLKPGGWLLDCPGEDSRVMPINEELIRRGFERLSYASASGGTVHRYRKQISK